MNTHTINILLIEDDEDDYVITKDLLHDVKSVKYELTWINNPKNAVKELCRNQYDVSIVDYQLGKYNGIDIIKEAQQAGCHGPFIMLTGQSDHAVDMKAMEAGASDFLVKGEINPHLLERTIRYAINSNKAERMLREAEEKYRAFFETTIEGIFQTTPSGILITANPGLAYICGYATPEELVKALRDIKNQLYVKPNRRAEFIRNLKKKDTIVNFESQIYRKDKSIIWISENARTIRDEKGKVLYYEGTVRDITIRKRVEEERGQLLREHIARTEAEKNAERTAKLLKITSALSEALTPDSVADVLVGKGIKLLGADAGSMVAVTKDKKLKIIQATGYPHEVIEKWSEFPLNADTPLADAIRRKKAIFLQTKEEAVQKYEEFIKQVTEENNAWACIPLVSSNKVLGAIGLSYKTTKEFDKGERTFLLTLAQQGVQALERSRLYDAEKLARTDSERAQERLNFLNEASKTLTRSLDYKTTLVNVAQSIVPKLADWCSVDLINDANKLENIAIAHTDVKKVELAKTLRIKYPSDPNSYSGIYKVIKTGKSELTQLIPDNALQAYAKDKEHLHLLRGVGFQSMMIVPLTIQKKTMGTITFVISPPRENVFTNDDLLFAEELARRAAVAIENARLFEKSQEGIRVRDEFLNIASHELKTPLTSLQLQMQFLLRLTERYEDAIPLQQLSKMLENSTQQVKRLTNLINNLLDVSRISGKKLELEMEEVDLNILIKDVVSRFEEASKASGSTIQVKNGIDIVGKWDKFRIDQVATNLLSNAIKYGEGKPIKVSVEKEKSTAKLSVEDKGIGISSGDEKKIFNRFVRTETAKKYGGLGLGLHIARQIVEAHGGSIDVKSKTNKGSTFIVRLPLPSAT